MYINNIINGLKNIKKTGKIYYTILTHGKDVKDMKKINR